MVFSSPSFIFLFLPCFFIIYALLPGRFRSAWIMLGSWIFYGFWRLDFLFLLIGVSFLAWLAGVLISRAELPGSAPRKKLILVLAVIINLLVLGYFKYFNFAVESLNFGLNALGLGSLKAWSVILPVGISFYIFQSMSYVIDVYRGMLLRRGISPSWLHTSPSSPSWWLVPYSVTRIWLTS